MERFFFQLHECGTVTGDDDGHEFADLAGARDHAVKAARDIMCQEVKEGSLCLSCHIEIENDDRQPLSVVAFRDAITLTGL